MLSKVCWFWGDDADRFMDVWRETTGGTSGGQGVAVRLEPCFNSSLPY